MKTKRFKLKMPVIDAKLAYGFGNIRKQIMENFSCMIGRLYVKKK